MNEAMDGRESFRKEVSAAIADMLYISESEAGLELLPEDCALTGPEAVEASLPAGSASESGEHFMQKLRDSVDPGDAGLTAYLGQWEHLFQLLRDRSADIRVYRSGSDPVEIRIVAFAENGTIVIRTSAVET